MSSTDQTPNVEQTPNLEQSNDEGGKITKEQLQGLLVLIQAVTLAQKRGAYSLSEAEQVSQAVKLFVAQTDESEKQNEETNELATNSQ